MNGDVITVDRLLREGMPVDVGMNGWTTLHRATLFNRNDVIKRLLHEGADVNSFDTRWEDTPLHKAAQWNYPEAVRLLLDNGADINLKNYDNETPLDVARKGSKVERLLLQVHQVKVHDKGTISEAALIKLKMIFRYSLLYLKKLNIGLSLPKFVLLVGFQ